MKSTMFDILKEFADDQKKDFLKKSVDKIIDKKFSPYRDIYEKNKGSYFDTATEIINTIKEEMGKKSKDVVSENGSKEFQILVPGVDKSDIKITFSDNVLNVSYSIKNTKSILIPSSFETSMSLDSSIYDISAIETRLDLGILYITVPVKKVAKSDTIEITIQ